MTDANLFNAIEHVTISAKDPKALAKWYCDTLGFKIAHESTRSLTTFVKLGGSLIEIIEAAKAERVPHEERDAGLRHLGISVDDIQRAYQHLTRKGLTCKSEPKEKEGVWTVFFEDPEHNLLHLIQRSNLL